MPKETVFDFISGNGRRETGNKKGLFAFWGCFRDGAGRRGRQFIVSAPAFEPGVHFLFRDDPASRNVRPPLSDSATFSAPLFGADLGSRL